MTNRSPYTLLRLGTVIALLAVSIASAQTPAERTVELDLTTFTWNLELPASPGHSGRLIMARNWQLHEGAGNASQPDVPFHLHLRAGSTALFGGEIPLDADRRLSSAEPRSAVHAPEVSWAAESALVAGRWSDLIRELAVDIDICLVPEGRILLGLAHLMCSRTDEAFALFFHSAGETDLARWSAWTLEFAVRHPGTPAATVLRADAAAREARFAEASAILRDAPDDARTSRWYVPWLLSRAATACALEKTDDALIDLLDVVERAPDLAEAHISLGARAILLSDGAVGAEAAFRRAVEIRESSLARVGLACALVAQAEFEAAGALLETAAESSELQSVVAYDRLRLGLLSARQLELELAALDSEAGSALEKFKAGLSMTQNQLKQLGHRAGIGGAITFNTFQHTAKDFGDILGKPKIIVGDGGKSSITVTPNLGTKLDKNAAFADKWANAQIGSHNSSIMNLKGEFNSLKSNYNSAGGVDTRVPANPLEGRRWQLMTYFGLYYPITFCKEEKR